MFMSYQCQRPIKKAIFNYLPIPLKAKKKVKKLISKKKKKKKKMEESIIVQRDWFADNPYMIFVLYITMCLLLIVWFLVL